MLPRRIKTSGLQAGAKITGIPPYSFINHQDHNTYKDITHLKAQFGRYLHFSHRVPLMKQQTYNIELPLARALMRMQMSNKRNVVLYLDKELVSKSREWGFNLSKTFENYLKQLLTQLSRVNPVNNSGSADKTLFGGPDRT